MLTTREIKALARDAEVVEGLLRRALQLDHVTEARILMTSLRQRLVDAIPPTVEVELEPEPDPEDEEEPVQTVRALVLRGR